MAVPDIKLNSGSIKTAAGYRLLDGAYGKETSASLLTRPLKDPVKIGWFSDGESSIILSGTTIQQAMEELVDKELSRSIGIRHPAHHGLAVLCANQACRSPDRASL
ncbi:NAD(P)H-dependent D-xylose reductase [Histoplasma capsulatum var. duboisii H88]|uniref:NAD(P)H-dependent D-xylose reductase n=1 Tax=Ajellomyces capsulatus (strain H88) TaxID=544711 RepID=F0UHT7_AJEC8|nr:NAD(P)H-dependent D-xylose reductase [Histoplasma capsulatum var. duboisii H88]